MAMTAELPIPGMGVTAELPIAAMAITAERPATGAWTAIAPAGPGMLVRVRIVEGRRSRECARSSSWRRRRSWAGSGEVRRHRGDRRPTSSSTTSRSVTTDLLGETRSPLRAAGDVEERARRRTARDAARAGNRRGEGATATAANGGSVVGAVRQQAKRAHRPAPARQPDESHRRAGDHARAGSCRLTGRSDDPR
jgi:hypothetical protein